jgi:hypothetical protein
MEAQNQRPDTLTDALAISVQELKDHFLFGVDLTDDHGVPYPETMYEFYIRSATEWFETEIPGLILVNKEITEHKDYYLNDYANFNFLRLNWFPTTEVSDISIQFPLSTNVLKFNPDWFRIDSTSSQTRLIPTQGSLSSILLGQGGNFLPLFYSGQDNMPHVWKVVYKAGFLPGKVPINIKELIGMKAAMGPLNIAGDLIAGAGIASKSIGIDGLSQSISTTASATNAGYGARILQYNKEIKDRIGRLKDYYGVNLRMAVI